MPNFLLGRKNPKGRRLPCSNLRGRSQVKRLVAENFFGIDGIEQRLSVAVNLPFLHARISVIDIGGVACAEKNAILLRGGDAGRFIQLARFNNQRF